MYGRLPKVQGAYLVLGLRSSGFKGYRAVGFVV